MLASTGAATSRLLTAATARSAAAMSAARAPIRPSAPDAASDPTLATSIDATSGMTVIRMRLMKTVPTGAAIARIVVAPGDEAPESARPRRNPAVNPIKTRVVNGTGGIVSRIADYELGSADCGLRVAEREQWIHSRRTRRG